MKPQIISYPELMNNTNSQIKTIIEAALLRQGIVGIKDVPGFEATAQRYIAAAREFAALPETIKERYKPLRDSGATEGYELGAERFINKNGEWQIDDNKASYYAYVPDQPANKWPLEVDLQTPYLELGELIFATGKKILDRIGLNSQVGLFLDKMDGYGRMLHYHKSSDATNDNPEWCGGHFDHGVFTGLVPAYYYRNGEAIPEPEEAGLFVRPTDGDAYEKIEANDKAVLYFQVGEFGQLVSNDRIKATQHKVLKAHGGIERFTFALFYSAGKDTRITSRSVLNKDARYTENLQVDGSLSYDKWQAASYARYRAK